MLSYDTHKHTVDLSHSIHTGGGRRVPSDCTVRLRGIVCVREIHLIFPEGQMCGLKNLCIVVEISKWQPLDLFSHPRSGSNSKQNVADGMQEQLETSRRRPTSWWSHSASTFPLNYESKSTCNKRFQPQRRSHLWAGRHIWAEVCISGFLSRVTSVTARGHVPVAGKGKGTTSGKLDFQTVVNNCVAEENSLILL